MTVSQIGKDRLSSFEVVSEQVAIISARPTATATRSINNFQTFCLFDSPSVAELCKKTRIARNGLSFFKCFPMGGYRDSADSLLTVSFSIVSLTQDMLRGFGRRPKFLGVRS